ERQTITFAKPSRHGDRGEIEQVREVRVVAEARIATDGIRGHLRARVRRAGGGEHEGFDLIPDRRHPAPQLFETPQPSECVDGGELLGAQDDALHRRIERSRLAFRRLALEEVTYRGIALRDPWTAVEKLRALSKRREIDGHGGATERLHTQNRF